MDNWYKSKKLFTHLGANGTAACGTVNRNRLNPPKALKEVKQRQGELMTWCQDKKEVYFLSTILQAKSTPSEKIKKR